MIVFAALNALIVFVTIFASKKEIGIPSLVAAGFFGMTLTIEWTGKSTDLPGLQMTLVIKNLKDFKVTFSLATAGRAASCE